MIRLALTTMLISSGAAAAGERPESTVKAFYDRFIHLSQEDYDKPYFESVDDLVSAKLLASLKSQHEYERHCASFSPPDEKPHMIDQNPFFLAPDGVKRFIGATPVVSDGVTTVDAHLGYDETTWHDTVVLSRENGHWLVADIRWEGGGSLSKRLSSFMQYQCAAPNSFKPD